MRCKSAEWQLPSLSCIVRATQPSTCHTPDMRHLNIEIKARCDDLAAVRSVLVHHDADFVGEDHQIDTYFDVGKGRLKLREIRTMGRDGARPRTAAASSAPLISGMP